MEDKIRWIENTAEADFLQNIIFKKDKLEIEIYRVIRLRCQKSITL